MRKPTLTPTPYCKERRNHNLFANENLDPNTVHAKLATPKSKPRHIKRKLNLETVNDSGGSTSDSCVQVIVRMRPGDKEEDESDQIVQKISSNSISILDQKFTFDSVADTTSSQNDIFQLVGLPLVENCLAGFNSSIFAYGQTGSGKTYTMWGPPNTLSAEGSLNEDRGLAPRVFERLFCRIKEEEARHSHKQISYQCYCSCLEIYNEQITDLLDPTQGNLQIREDVKTGIYVDRLTAENVITVKDVIKLLKKGLANRKTGSTSVNAESSRSHCVFTCVVESQSKGTDDCLSHLRISRMNLIDLAGSESQKMTGAVGERLKEAGNINRSLSQLGNLINILAEVARSGKPRHIPYRDSKLTFLLQESLGGNAKLAMICAISPSNSCKSETVNTLRFAHRAKAIKNNAVINEVVHDDVKVLREQIRELKDELFRMNNTEKYPQSNGSYSTVRNARKSLNLLRMSLNYPRILPIAENDSDVEMEIDEEVIEKFSKENENDAHRQAIDMEVKPCVNDVREPLILEETNSSDDRDTVKTADYTRIAEKSDEESNFSILRHKSFSPRLHNFSRKSLKTSSSISASQGTKFSFSAADNLNRSNLNDIQVQTSKDFLSSTEHMEASLHHGLQIIDRYNQGLSLRQPALSLSAKSNECKSFVSIVKNVGTQILSQEFKISRDSSSYTCSHCKNKPPPLELSEVNHDIELQLVPIDGLKPADKSKNQTLKKVEKVLTGAFRREMELENYCVQQAAEIAQLNQLIQQYKHERECTAMIEQTREAKISRLESLMDETLPTEEFMEQEHISLINEHMYLKEKYENHPDVLQLKVELKRVQDDLEGYRSFFNLGERDVLLEEILDLKSQLQHYIDSSSMLTQNRSPPQQLTHPTEVTKERINEKLEEERRYWTETESKWISLLEELKIQLEANQSLAEKRKRELDLEKKCTVEVNEAFQEVMQQNTRILEQYADLEAKHNELYGRHRQMMEEIEDVKNAAAKAGVKGTESRFIRALAAEISNLKADREKEREIWINEIKGLRAQVRDSAEALQAAGELVVRMKEAEETAASAQKRVSKAELETRKAYEEIDNLKKNHERQIALLNPYLAESCLQKAPLKPEPAHCNITGTYKGGESLTDQKYEECANFGKGDGEFSRGTEPNLWYSDYDRCNM